MFRRLIFICAALLCVASLIIPASAASGYEVYAVQPGDTLAAIARRVKVSEGRIAQENGLAPGAKLQTGQSLKIPTALNGDSEQKDQDEFAAEERQAADFGKTQLTIQPAAQARSGPVVGYLGIATGDTVALADPRSARRLCAIAKQTSLCVSSQYGDHYGVLMIDGAVAWVPKRAVALQQVELVAGVDMTPSGSGSRPAVVEAAFRYYGLPYRYGGAPPGPTDCSALVQAAFRDCGMMLPRTAASQFCVGGQVPGEQLAIGDRIYFYNKDGRIGHTGIYIGNGQFIHASSRRGYVGIDSLLTGFYRSRYAGARRP